MQRYSCDNKKESIGEYDNAETKPIVLLGVSTTDCRWAEYRGGRSSASEKSWSSGCITTRLRTWARMPRRRGTESRRSISEDCRMSVRIGANRESLITNLELAIGRGDGGEVMKLTKKKKNASEEVLRSKSPTTYLVYKSNNLVWH